MTLGPDSLVHLPLPHLSLLFKCHIVKNIKPTKIEESDGLPGGVLPSFSRD